jgi:hypothetical protein
MDNSKRDRNMGPVFYSRLPMLTSLLPARN